MCSKQIEWDLRLIVWAIRVGSGVPGFRGSRGSGVPQFRGWSSEVLKSEVPGFCLYQHFGTAFQNFGTPTSELRNSGTLANLGTDSALRLTYRNMFFATNHMLAGLSASLLMYHGNQYSP